MTLDGFPSRLRERAARFRLEIPDSAVDQFQAYLGHLARWNAKINLTSLPLEPPSDEAMDKLLIEPLAAARFLEDSPMRWVDLGSGGGSPAIPLKILRPRTRLMMVESRSRKASFLREMARALNLQDAVVVQSRFEELSKSDVGAVLVTVRAIRGDQTLLDSAAALLEVGGRLLWFGFHGATPEHPKIRFIGHYPLLDEMSSTVAVFERVFHVEHHG